MSRYSSPNGSSYGGWLRFAKKARWPERGRPVCNNTRAFLRPGDAVAIRYHTTDIVTYYPDGSVEVANGGWYSTTTACRIHDFTPAWIGFRTIKGSWYVANPGAAAIGPENSFCFVSRGLRLWADGRAQRWDRDRATTYADMLAAEDVYKANKERDRIRQRDIRRAARAKIDKINRRGRTCANFLVRKGLVHLLAEAAKKLLGDGPQLVENRELRCVTIDDDRDALRQLVAAQTE